MGDILGLKNLGTGGGTIVKSEFGGTHGGASPFGSASHWSFLGFFCSGHIFLLFGGQRP